MKKKIDFKENFKFKNDLELCEYIANLMGTKIEKKYKKKVLVDNLLKTLVYYLYACKEKEEQNLKQMLKEIEIYKENPDDKENFYNKPDIYPIDHPARIYKKVIMAAEKDEIEDALKIITKLINKKVK